MSLRSITLASRSGETINAVLLFGFSVPLIGKNFMVYTLNEELEVGYVRLYMASLLKTEGQYSLGALESRQDRALALQALKQIVKS
ncbi:hypothetical protein [Pseudomonas sp. HLT2-19-2]